MKTVRTITHFTNCLCVCLTLLVATVYHQKALSGYFLLGVFQIAISVIITLTCSSDKNLGKPIALYWLFVALYFLVALPILNKLGHEVFAFMFIPMLIAIYNCYLTYIIYKRP